MLLFRIHWIVHLLVSLLLLMCYAQCCHGDGSGVKACAYEVSWLLSGYCASTFIVVMATVVMGDTCVQSIMAMHTIVRLLCWK